MTSAIEGDILFVFPQRRNYYLEYTQPVVKFFAQMRLEFLTGCGQYPGVYCNFMLAAQPPHAQILQNAQQLGLRRRRHLADLVEEQRTPVSLLKAARRTLHGSCKGALLVAE